MKILLCHNYYATRGGEAHVVEAEMRMLQNHGHEVLFYSKDNADIAAFSSAQKIAAIPRGFHNTHVIHDMRHILHTYKPDIAHIHNVYPQISPAIYRFLYSAGVPVVQTFHNFRFLCINGLLRHNGETCKMKNTPLHCIRSRCYRDSYFYSLWYSAINACHRARHTFTRCIDRYITLNSFTRDIFIDAGYPQDKCVVKPNSASIQESPLISHPENYAVFIGRLSEEKGIWPLLYASERVPELPLYIIGDGILEKDAHAFVKDKKLSHITFFGRLSGEESAEILRKARVALCPSTCYENCPLSIINAVYSGTPVIASRTGGLPDFVPEGIAGWLVEPGDVDALEHQLKKIAESPEIADVLRKGTRAFGHEHFSEEKNYTALMSIYRAAQENAAVRCGIDTQKIKQQDI